MCQYINQIDTNTKFIIIMHPKEFRKTKNGTGHLTRLSLKNSELFIGIDFSKHEDINKLIQNNNCFVLYPHKDSIKLNTQNIQQHNNKQNIIFIIDSSWACSKKILALSKNLNSLPKISFNHKNPSQFKIKTQPNIDSLSTIESTLCILELLNKHNMENITKVQLESFLSPFKKMVDYQINCASEKNIKNPRFLIR